jgi:hypothetical protein
VTAKGIETHLAREIGTGTGIGTGRDHETTESETGQGMTATATVTVIGVVHHLLLHATLGLAPELAALDHLHLLDEANPELKNFHSTRNPLLPPPPSVHSPTEEIH